MTWHHRCRLHHPCHPCNPWFCLFLVRRHFGQDRRLQPFFFFNVQRQSAGCNEARSHENDQVPFDVLIDIGAEKPADERNIADDRDLIFRLLHVLAHQPAEHDCLPIPHTHVRGHFAGAKDRLVDHVLGQKNRRRGRYSHGTPNAVNPYRIDGTAVIYEAFKFDTLWHQDHNVCPTVRADHRFNLKGHASIASLKSLRRCRRHYDGDSSTNSGRTTADCGDLRCGERRWITKFSHDLDHSALSALGRD